MKQFGCYVPAELHAKYKARCWIMDKTITEDIIDHMTAVIHMPLPEVRAGRPTKEESRDPARRHFWIRRRQKDQIVLSFNSIERCEEIIELLTDEGGELLAD